MRELLKFNFPILSVCVILDSPERNPLTLCCISVTIVYVGPIFFLIRRSKQKISYERRVYESVDDNSLSYALSQKPTKKRTHATKV